MEDWELGTSKFVIQIGNGQPVYVTGIDGTVTAMTGSVADNSVARATLFAVTYPGDNAQDVKIISSPDNPEHRWEQSVSRNLLSLVLKSVGPNVTSVPVHVSFPTPVLIPNGILISYFFNEEYSHNSIIYDPVQALDTEVHLRVYYNSGS
jgi:hypothetical protein